MFNWKLELLLKFIDSDKYVHPHHMQKISLPLTLSLFFRAIRPSGQVLGGSSNISIMYFNCRGIVPKFDELVWLCSANKPSIVCLTIDMEEE